MYKVVLCTTSRPGRERESGEQTAAQDVPHEQPGTRTLIQQLPEVRTVPFVNVAFSLPLNTLWSIASAVRESGFSVRVQGEPCRPLCF